jgi:hypothetical protein
MNLPYILRRFIPMRWQRPSKDETISIVLLLRKPHFFTAGELERAAERAWRTPFTGGGENSRHFVMQTGVTMMKAGPHLLNFFHYPQPYIDNPKENVDWLPQASQREAWIEHTACLGVDYLNRDTDVELIYCVLSKLVAELLDENCTGIYTPRERSLTPNDKSLYQDLFELGSFRDPGVKIGH